MTTQRVPVRTDLAAIASRAAHDAGGVSPAFLDGYLELLDSVSDTGRRLSRKELGTRRELGARAAEQNVPLRVLVDLYLSANWLAWPLLPAVGRARGKDQVGVIAQAILRATDDTVVALADGYDSAQRRVMRQEEAARREFIDDLLHGQSSLGRLAERAERFGLRLTASHMVAAAQAPQPFTDGDPATHRVQSAMLTRFDARDVLITTKDGLLLCIAPGTITAAADEFTRHVGALLDGHTWRVAVGRAHPGPGGVLHSYEEARNTLKLAESLGLAQRQLNAADLLVFQVLLRDRDAIIDLVTTVLGPLRHTRGGARPLLDTLSAYFATGQVIAATARQLHLSIRAVSYRLDRIRTLTGHNAREPDQRFALEAAVLGARLLGWPSDP